MTPRQFDWHMRVHGPAVDCWPPGEKAGALALLAADDRARRRLADALERLDDGHDDDPELLHRLRGQVRIAVARRAAAVPALRWSMRGSALAACMIAGLWAGGVLDSERDPLATVQVAALEAMQ